MSENSSAFPRPDMENGGKWSPGKASPAAAAACRECNRAAECSCAFLLSSATELDLGSELLVGVNAEETDAIAEPAIEQVGELLVGFIGQHEQRPGKPEEYKKLKDL